MVHLNNQLSQKIRPPPPEKIAEAFSAFLGAQYRSRNYSSPLAEAQVRQIAGAFDYLRSTADDADGTAMSNGDLRLALKLLASRPWEGRYEAHLQLASRLYEEVEMRQSIESVHGSPGKDPDFGRSVTSYIKILSRAGQTKKAREVLEQYWQSDLKQSRLDPWLNVLRGFVNEHNPEELSATVANLPTYGVPFDSNMHGAIVREYAREDDVEATKKWYYRPIADGGRSRPSTDHAVYELCIRKNEYEWGEKIFRSNLEDKQPSRQTWASILKWSAAKGKGVDEIERMMNVMIRRKEKGAHNGGMDPDIDMINELIELAISRDDPYTAERYVSLSQRLNLRPNARTFLLQLDYRIKVGDLDGARAAYSNFQTEEDRAENEVLRLSNKLVVALCERDQPLENIMPIVEDLSERKIRFEPATVAALVRLYLNHGKSHEAHELLNTSTVYHNPEERDSIREAFISYILTRSNRTALAWDAYLTVRAHFPDTSVATRAKLMTEFFERRRPDLGVYVFGHMRQSPHLNRRPDAATYKACFEGIARAGGDMSSLHLVHNMLKLDTEIEPNTRLYNGLMLAYTACGDPSRALEFWHNIVHSHEGPTYSSIQIALQVCEVEPSGEETARNIWARLRRFGIKVTREIYAAYVGALAGQTRLKECIELVENIEAEIGEKPDALL